MPSNSDNIDNQEAVKLEACPFCGGDASGPVYSGEWGSNDVYEVECPKCCIGIEGYGPGEPSAKAAAIAAWNTRTTPAKLDAPDNQEALADEGVDWCARAADLTLSEVDGPPAIRSESGTGVEHASWMLHEIVGGRLAGRKAHRWLGYAQGLLVAEGWLMLDTAKQTNKQASDEANRTLPSNEALAGDDRNGVEARRIKVLRDALNFYADPKRHLGPDEGIPGFYDEMNFGLNAEEALEQDAALSRAPSSPQADVADVEREIARFVLEVNEYDDRTSPEAWPEALLITSEELADLLRRFASTMTTRPAGVEEVDQELQEIADGAYGDGPMCRGRARDALDSLTKPAALPKDAQDADR